MKAASALSLLVVAEVALALHIPVSRVNPRAPLPPGLERRGYAVLATSGAPELKNANNNIYTSKMRIKGRDVVMQVDTGSSDTWLYPSQDKQDLFTDAIIHRDIPIKLSYGRGSVSGYVTQMTVDFAGYTVRNQSLLLVQEHQDMSLIESNLSDGLLGLGFDTLSRISNEVSAATNQNWGRTLLSNIFTSDTTTPNHIAFRLDRIWDGNNTDVGAFDIGSYAPGLEAIKDTAQIPIFSSSLQQKLYWNVLVDGVSINGKAQTLTSSVRGQQVPPAGKAAALLDTGYSLPQISPALAHTLYTAMGGVLLQDGTNTTYAVPCTAEAELVFQIGGHTIPIHPLDLTLVQTIKTTDDEIFTVCFNAFQPFSSNAGAGQLDYILGDSFLRNVYSLYDFGDFVQGLSGITQGNPYIKLLPLTDPTAASAEFKTARAAQLNAPGMPHQLDPTTVNGKIRELRGTGGTNNNSAGRTGWSWLVVGFAGFIGAWISS